MSQSPRTLPRPFSPPLPLRCTQVKTSKPLAPASFRFQNPVCDIRRQGPMAYPFR
jgi:hypothetical protein